MKNSSGQATYSYVYDRYGNRWQQNALQGGNSFSQSFNTATNQLSTGGYTYDAAGNMTYDGVSHHFTYDAEGNQLQVDSGQTATFVLDALNHSVSQTIGGQVTESLYDTSGRLTSSWTSHTASSESHIFADGIQIAFRSGDGKTYFKHTNWLKTDRVHTDLNGAVAATFTSLPWGDGGSINASESYGGWDFARFADLDDNYEDGTYHAQYRFYSPAQGHWMSPDPYDGSYDVTNPQSFNRYAYVLNNPLSFRDPLGLDDNCVVNADGSVTCSGDPGSGDPCATNTSVCVSGGSGGSGGVGGGGGSGGGGGGSGNYPCLEYHTLAQCIALNGGSQTTNKPPPAPSNSRYCGVLANCKTPTQCVGQALRSNAVSLALDGAGFAAGFLPGGGAVVAVAQIGVGTASTINSAFSASTATATGQRALGGALGSIASIQLAALAPAAQFAGVAAKAVPFLGALVSLGSGLNDAYQTYADYQSCLAGH